MCVIIAIHPITFRFTGIWHAPCATHQTNDNMLSGIEQWGRKIPFSKVVACPDISTLMVRLELGEGFALLTKVIEGHDAPNLRYWPVPFPEAHAEIVCICREHTREEISSLIQRIANSELVHLGN